MTQQSIKDKAKEIAERYVTHTQFDGPIYLEENVIEALLAMAAYMSEWVDEFDNIKFASGDKVEYQGKIYPICGIDFEERLFSIEMNIPGSDLGDRTWIRCENAKYIALPSAEKESNK